MLDHKALLQPLLEICEHASQAILNVYHKDDFSIQNKQDQSPVTAADLAAHEIIQKGLATLTPDIPQLSEEAADINFSQRQQWNTFWCIDPLDGTKEFIRKNDEFTVNIALIHEHKPVLGIIYIPVTGTAYWGSTQLGSWKQQSNAAPAQIRTRPLGDNLMLAASRRHGQDLNAQLIKPIQDDFKHIENIHLGSSLKMCLIAEGKADFYPRLFPTSEWDTAAAQAIVEAAGGRLVNAHTLEPLDYNQKESLENPFFFVCGDPIFPLELLRRDR